MRTNIKIELINDSLLKAIRTLTCHSTLVRLG
jgi:hypothetical protein